MSRKKVKLAYIANDSERKASYKKRKKGLMKKVSELSTLCGVEACAIIYSQYDPEPAVWPSREGVLSAFSRFNRLSEMDQTRKKVNQEEFTRQRIKKAREQLARVDKENKRTEMENFMYECMAGLVSIKQFNMADASDMTFVIRQTRRDIMARIEVSRATLTAPPPPSPPPPPPSVIPPSGEEIFGSLSMINDITSGGINKFQNFGVEWDYSGEMLPFQQMYPTDFGGN